MLKRILITSFLLLVPATMQSSTLPQSAADVKVSGELKPDKIKKGQISRATVVMEIPQNLHVQSNKPLDKFLIPTKLEIDAPRDLKVGPVSYPRAISRRLGFSKQPVAVYEGKAIIRFNVTVPANYGSSSAELRGNLRFQACNNDSCFPPVNREVKLWLNVE